MKKFIVIHCKGRDVGIGAVCKSLALAQDAMIVELKSVLEKEGTEEENVFLKREWAAAFSHLKGKEIETCGIYPHAAWWQSGTRRYDWKIVEMKV